MGVDGSPRKTDGSTDISAGLDAMGLRPPDCGAGTVGAGRGGGSATVTCSACGGGGRRSSKYPPPDGTSAVAVADPGGRRSSKYPMEVVVHTDNDRTENQRSRWPVACWYLFSMALIMAADLGFPDCSHPRIPFKASMRMRRDAGVSVSVNGTSACVIGLAVPS